jgi:uncharacterized protein YggT (Ycf19 family)
MAIVDFILNLAGLLLWLNWRSMRFDPLTKRLPATLMGTLRPAGASKFRRWPLLVGIVVLLVVRALVYHWLAPFGSFLLHFSVISPAFRRDSLPGMLLVSFLSFGVALGIFYTVLLLLSLLKGPDPIHRLVKIPLGRVDEWSAPVKIILPFLVAAISWGVLVAATGPLHLFPPADSMALRIEQSVVVALGIYLVWKFPLTLLLVLHLLGTYIYFGKHPFWNYVNVTAQKLLRPLKKIPLRAGRVDFAPLIGLVVVFLVAVAAERGLAELYRRLPI